MSQSIREMFGAIGRMKRLVLLVTAIGVTASVASAQQIPAFRLMHTIPLPGVHGRIDHFDVDLAGRRLFMSALGNDTLEVFDLRTNEVVHTIGGLREPQGITYVPVSRRIFMANGGDGTVRVFDGDTYKLLKIVHFPGDADDTRYDAAANQVIVGYGDAGEAGLAFLDGSTGKLLATIKLPDHPESFQLEKSGSRIFVNIPTAGNIIDVVDRTGRKVIATWRLTGAVANFPMALDGKDHRLFVTCRSPAEMLVLDTRSGEIVARVPAVGAADDMWYDAARKSIYITGGEGFISVIRQEDANHYRGIAQIRTVPGGRTSLFLPQWNRLFLGVWGLWGRPEELRIYEIGP